MYCVICVMNFVCRIGILLSAMVVQNQLSLVIGLLDDDIDFARSVLMNVARNEIRTPTIRKTKARNTGGGSRTNLNKFNEAMDQVERAMAQADLSRKISDLTKLKQDITNAIKRGNVRHARRALGFALHNIIRSQSSNSGRRKRSTATRSSQTNNFFRDIKRDVGKKGYSDFLALQGQVTLMYAIDITGSMRDEIVAAKSIATAIIRSNRTEPVDYILSTFGDPVEQGSVVTNNEKEGYDFTKRIANLVANFGDDCPEYAYHGMISALDEDPRYGSPLYVFTDAPPKDATEENMETLEIYLGESGVTVNFFAHRSCGSPANFSKFEKVAESSGGLLLHLPEHEIAKVSKFTGIGLGGTTAIARGSTNSTRKKRASSGITGIAIPVDDTVSKLIILVITEKSPNVHLKTPNGQKWTRGINMLSNVIIYDINSPAKGTWKLHVSSTVGNYKYLAKVNSLENVDFKHYFTKIHRTKIVPVRYPLQGEIANASISVSGFKKIQPNSLLVDIIDISGKVLKPNNNLTKVGKSGSRFVLSFQPPGVPFKLMLKGNTTRNKYFQRISRQVDKAKTLLLKEFYTQKHYTLKKGGRTKIYLHLFNSSPKHKEFSLVFRDTFNCAIYLRKSSNVKKILKVRRRRILMVLVNCKDGKDVVGKTENIIIMVKDVKGNIVSAEIVPLMII